MFHWFEKSKPRPANNGQVHNDIIEKEKNKATLRKIFSTRVSKFKGN